MRNDHLTSEAPTWTLDQLLKIVQLASILIAAAWALLQYFSFRKENQLFILAQQELSIEAAQIGLVAAEYSAEQASIDLNKSKNQRLSGEITFEVELKKELEDGRFLYDVLFGLAVTNQSDREFEVSYEVTEYFLGALSEARERDLITPVNLPTYRPSEQITFSSHAGAIDWMRIGSQAFAYPAAKGEMQQKLRDLEFSTSGTVTSVLGPGETSFGNRHYLVVGEPGQYVSFSTTFGVDRAISGSEVWRYGATEVLELPSGLDR